MPRSAMFRSLVIFACLGHVLGESDPSCWLQSRPTGTGQDSAIRSRPGTDLDLLGSKSTSTQARLNELRARMKEEEEKIKDMKAELRNLKRIACPSGGDYVTWVTLTGSEYTMTNGDTGFFVRTWSPNDEPATCDDFAIRSGSALLVEDKSSSVSPPCNLTLYFAIFLQVIFTTGPLAQNTFSRNVSTVNVTFEGDASHLTFSVYHDPDGAGAPSAVGHTFHPGENIIDVSSFGPISGFDLNGFNLGGGSLPLGIEFLQFNGFTLCGTQATVVGDPHIKTLDGRHYTLMNQGTFSLWRYSGVSADVMMQNLFVSSTSIDVDWQVYAHYSGHQSYTKGLLLLDKSGGSVRQSLEITSKDCQWRASASEQDPSATGLQLHTANNRTRVSFVMIKQGVRKEVAKLSVSCRKGHNINVAIDMKHSADLRFVDGELRVARTGAPVSTLQTESDEFECHSLVIPVIHRDIKPANVMKIKPGSSSDVKLIDFGLATFSKEGQGASRIGGTPEFMAPEVWSGTYGRQCDCWSIGMMLYYLLVAHFPFQRCEPSRYPRMWPSFKLTFPSNQGWGSRNLRSARDLIRKLLTLEPRMRLSAGGALKSEFIKKYGRSSSFAGYASAAMGEMMRGYQNFNATPKLTHGLRTFSQVPRVMRVVLLLTASKMDARELAKVRQVFDSIDCDHDGFISSNDMEDFLNGWMSRMGRLAHSLKSFSLPNAKTQDAATLMRLADLDEDGSIGFSEFLVAWLYANQPSGENLLRQAFNTLASVDGKVSRQEVRNALGSKQMQHLDEQLAEDIAAIFPEERLNFQRFQECLQRHEDLGPNAVQLTMRLRDNKARATWATLGQDGDDSDLDERPERSFYGACCRLLGCAQEPNPEEFEVDLVHP